MRRMKKASRGWRNPKDKQSRSGLDCEKEQKSWHRLATSGLDSRNAINDDNVPIGVQIASPDSRMPHQTAQFPAVAIGKQTRCALSRRKHLSITDGSIRAYQPKSPNVFIPILFYDAPTSTKATLAHSLTHSSRALFTPPFPLVVVARKNNNQTLHPVDIPRRIQFAVVVSSTSGPFSVNFLLFCNLIRARNSKQAEK